MYPPCPTIPDIGPNTLAAVLALIASVSAVLAGFKVVNANSKASNGPPTSSSESGSAKP